MAGEGHNESLRDPHADDTPHSATLSRPAFRIQASRYPRQPGQEDLQLKLGSRYKPSARGVVYDVGTYIDMHNQYSIRVARSRQVCIYVVEALLIILSWLGVASDLNTQRLSRQ
jgi:hypothetical protein